MKKLIYIAILNLIALSLTAAAPKGDKHFVVERPDMEAIKREVTDSTSKYYYPRLMARYEKNETVMTLPEYRYLYLGQLFQEDFNPYRESTHAKHIEPLYYQDKHTRAELDTIITYAEMSLKDNPFDLRQLNFLTYAYRKRGKVNKANIWQYRMNHLLEAIISTGTGLDPENAWYVINPEHEYIVINFLGREADAQEFVQPYYDHITLKPQPGNAKAPSGYYFNIKNLLEEYYRKHPEE